MKHSPEERLQLLLEASRLLSSKLELSELLTTVMEMAAKVVGAERASILLVDPETGELFFDVALDLRRTAKSVRLKPGQGIAGRVAQTGEPIIANDVHKDARWSAKVDEVSGFVTRSILAAPMVLKGKLIGVVEAINKTGGPFTDWDLRHFEGFASQCAVAIENARLFASVQEERRNLRAIFDTMSEGAVYADLRGRVIASNHAARALLGLEDGDLDAALGRLRMSPPLEELYRTPEGARAFELLREEPKRLVLSGVAIRLGSRAAEAGGRGWVWVFRDVTEERREERLKRSFLALISHKLRTPLVSILGYSQLLGEGSASPQMAKRAADSIHEQGAKLSDLVDKLLKFVTVEGDVERDREPVDLDKAAAEAQAKLKPLLDRRRARLRVEPAPGRALGDPLLIRDLLANLIENGVKFNEKESPSVLVRFRDAGARIEAEVEDDGPGIPPEDQRRVFAGFHQIEDDFTGQVDGWGLGLPFARRVAELHGGSLRLDSKLGKGTRILFDLPKEGA